MNPPSVSRSSILAARWRGGRGVAALPAVLAAALALALGGCAHGPAAPAAARYQCDHGGVFTLSHPPGGDAVLDLAGMRFALRDEGTDASGQRLGCGVLTLWRNGDVARLRLQGDPDRQCRVVR